jgi:transcriptional regulator with XRE-family HTH domain
MISGPSIRAKRLEAGIVAQILCKKLGRARSWLTDIERGYRTPSVEQLQRIDSALDELIRAKAALQQNAEALGWPALEAVR